MQYLHKLRSFLENSNLKVLIYMLIIYKTKFGKRKWHLYKFAFSYIET